MVRILKAIGAALQATASNDPESFCRETILTCANDLGYHFVDPAKIDKAIEKLEQDIREN